MSSLGSRRRRSTPRGWGVFRNWPWRSTASKALKWSVSRSRICLRKATAMRTAGFLIVLMSEACLKSWILEKLPWSLGTEDSSTSSVKGQLKAFCPWHINLSAAESGFFRPWFRAFWFYMQLSAITRTLYIYIIYIYMKSGEWTRTSDTQPYS